MDVKCYAIDGVLLLTPRVFGDHRGFFLESYNKQVFAEAGIPHEFVQDNHSKSRAGTLRGLHYQVGLEQDKLVRCISGAIFDVAVDIRPNSPSFGQWIGEELNQDNKKQLFVPKGFAHGFQVLSDSAEVVYKCSNFYSMPDERGIMFNDPDIQIAWPDPAEPLLSDKDKLNNLLKDIDTSEIKGC